VIEKTLRAELTGKSDGATSRINVLSFAQELVNCD
jgi:hypothetical protein